MGSGSVGGSRWDVRSQVNRLFSIFEGYFDSSLDLLCYPMWGLVTSGYSFHFGVWGAILPDFYTVVLVTFTFPCLRADLSYRF